MINMCVDEPKADNIILSESFLDFSGWAIADTGIKQVRIYVDGKFIGSALFGNPRPDVMDVYPHHPLSDYSGFWYELNLTPFTNGTYRISVETISNSGETLSVKKIVHLNVDGDKKGIHLGLFYRDYLLKYLPLENRMFINTGDPVRYGAITLAIKRIRDENIPGSFADAGVWRGYTSRIIHLLEPERRFYLFDTFEGFPSQDDEGKEDTRFTDTSIEIVRKTIGNLDNIIIRKGYFPDTTRGLEGERFSFVMLDLDKYEPTLAGLRFFYERVSPGGYIFIHDYNSPESQWAVSRAVSEFMADKPEKIFEIPDECGSVIIRRE